MNLLGKVTIFLKSIAIIFVFGIIFSNTAFAAKASQKAVATSTTPSQSAPTSSNSDADTAYDEPGDNPNDPGIIDDADELNEVVVVATRTPMELINTPQSVSVVTAKDMRNKVSRDLGDVLQNVIGVSVVGGARPQGQEPNIRGFGANRVQMRLDDMRIDFPTVHGGDFVVNPEDLEQIEVLKGSSSALYGSDALGGVINMRSRDVNDYLEPGQNIGTDSNFIVSTVDKQLRYTQKAYGAYKDKLEVINSYTYWHTGQSMKLSDGTKLNYSGMEGNGVFTKVILHPRKETDLGFSYNLFDQKSKQPLDAQSNTLLGTATTLTKNTEERNTFNILLRNRSEMLGEFKGNVYWNLNNNDFYRYNSPTNQTDLRQLDTFGFDIKNTNKFLLWKFENVLTYGTEFWRDKLYGTTEQSTGNTGINSYPSGRSFDYGLFVQDEISFLNNRVLLVPGFRWDYYESSASGRPTNDDNAFSPKIAGNIRVWRDVHLYSNFGYGFRPPRLTELYPSGTHFLFNQFVPNPGLQPEKSNQFEVGTRGKFWRFKWDSVFFLTHAKNFIETQVNVVNIRPFGPFGPLLPWGGTTQSINQSHARLWGFENSLSLELYKGLILSGQYFYMTGKNTDTDVYLNSIPAPYFDGALTYNFKGFFAQIHTRYTASMDSVPNAESYTAGYTLWDAYLGYVVPKFENKYLSLLSGFRFNMGVENIFDKPYRTRFSNANMYGPATNFIFGFGKSINFGKAAS